MLVAIPQALKLEDQDSATQFYFFFNGGKSLVKRKLLC